MSSVAILFLAVTASYVVISLYSVRVASPLGNDTKIPALVHELVK
jgi:hypothetical protein